MYRLIDRTAVRLLALLAGIAIALPWHLVGPFPNGTKLALAAALLTFGLMPMMIRLAYRLGALDRPDARRVHAAPTPRIGGLAVLVSVNLTLFLNFDYSDGLKGVCLSALMVAILSFWDDLRGLSAVVKLLGQLVALALLTAFGVHAEFAPDTWWGYGLEYLVTALWVIGITNAFNFLDGINGLAAALAATVCGLMAMLAWHTGQAYMLMLTLAMAGAAVGFLPDNARYSRPARIFLGDVGSTYIGWLMAAVAILGGWSSEGPVKAYSAPILIFSVMIFDMIYTTVARIWRGDVRNLREWVEYVGRDHLHHRLMHVGCSQSQAVLLIVGFALLLGLSALALVEGSLFTVGLLLFQAVVFYSILSYLMLRQADGGRN